MNQIYPHKSQTIYLNKIIYISGWIEIIFGIIIIFLGPILTRMNIPHIPFWHISFGIALVFMGILLAYSAEDLEKYGFIPLISCIFRIILSGVQIYTAITIPQLMPYLLAGGIFDLILPILIIIFLKREHYLTNDLLKWVKLPEKKNL